MTARYNYLIVLLILAAGFSACRKDADLPPADPGYACFPSNTGHYVVYQVDSISTDAFTGNTDTFRYQVMERIESEFVDNQGRNTLRIERYKRQSDTSIWAIKDVWYANLTPSTAERTEENIRFVKLIFPVKAGAQWNGNAYNNLGEETWEYTSVDASYHNGLHQFDSTVSVLHRDINNAVFRRYGTEVYARHVGLVYKKFIDQEKNPIDGTIKAQTDYSYAAIAWGD